MQTDERPSEIRDRGARLALIRRTAARVAQQADPDDHRPTVDELVQAIAIAVGAVLQVVADEESQSWERDRERRRAFGDELKRLATGDGTALRPPVRTACLGVLAQAIDEGWDEPPTSRDYVEYGVQFDDDPRRS